MYQILIKSKYHSKITNLTNIRLIIKSRKSKIDTDISSNTFKYLPGLINGLYIHKNY